MTTDKETQEELRKREDEARRRRVVKYGIQGIRYIMGYLPDYPFDIKPNWRSNPIVILIKIYWGSEDYQTEKMPLTLQKELEKIEQEALQSKESMRQSKVS
jgi:hypothetical protein